MRGGGARFLIKAERAQSPPSRALPRGYLVKDIRYGAFDLAFNPGGLRYWGSRASSVSFTTLRKIIVANERTNSTAIGR